MRVTVERGRELIFDCVSPIEESKIVPIDESFGFVLKKPLVAQEDYPNSDISRFDGYAICEENLEPNKEYKIVDKSELSPGECKRVDTGCEVPKNTDVVVMIEHVEKRDRNIIVKKVPNSRNIISKGSDIANGDVILSTESFIDGVSIGAFPTLEKEEVEIYRKARVGVVATGGEITEKNDVNTRLLTHLVNKNGGILEKVKRVKDSEHLIEKTFLDLVDDDIDFILSVGGTSKGTKDYIESCISDIGELLFNEVRMRPGKTFTVGKAEEVPIFSFSGNVTPCLIQANLFLAPVLRYVSRLPLKEAKKLRSDISISPDTHRILSKKVTNIFPAKKVGKNKVKPVFGKYMTVLPFLDSDCLMLIGEGKEDIKKDDKVSVVPVRDTP